MSIKQIQSQADALLIRWDDGTENRFHYLWLRDNSPEARTASGQRLIETLSIPDDVAPVSVELSGPDRLTIEWGYDGHISHYPTAWLRTHAYPAPPMSSSRRLWDAGIQSALPHMRYPEIIAQPQKLRQWLRWVHDYGFAILHDTPIVPGTVLEIVRLFGYVRETNYGPLFDVRSVVAPNNLAFTGLPLSVHTDNPYREPVPTLQLLHCLASELEGGDSILVDGFNAAGTLRRQFPAYFELLSTQPVRFRFQDEHNDLSAESPVIRLDTRGDVAGIRFNNRSLMPFDFSPEQVAAYYQAYRAFARLLQNPEYTIQFKMQPGDLFIVDNERVLHGRTGFSSNGSRHLQGCYADRDGLYSRLRVLERDMEGRG